MGLQTAYYTQPYISQPGLSGGAWNGYAPAMPAYSPAISTMTQLPSMPQPFFNSTATPMSEIPTPWQVAPAVMSQSSTPYTLAASVPVVSGAPTPDIPPPHMVAPWIYHQHYPLYPNPYAGMNGLNGLNGLNGQNGIQPKTPSQPPPAPTPPPPAQPKGPSTDLNAGDLSDTTIRSLNEQLNNPDANIRADGAMELFKILEGNSSLAEDPVYAPYINAFMEKIMKDPSPLVRGGGELILDMGYVPNPSDTVKKRLTSLAKQKSLTGEDNQVGGILGRLKSGPLLKKASKSVAPSTPQAQTAPDVSPTQAGLPSAASNGNVPPEAQAPMGYPQQQPAALGASAAGYPAYSGMPQAGLFSSPQAIPMQMASGMGAMPQAGGLPYNGSRLNIMSPQQQMMPVGAGFPQFGQRLNIQEGY